jgi:adenine deaminase
VRQAMSRGLKPVTAIQMATLNTAEHFGVAMDVGQIAPGRSADILLVSDLFELKPDVVIARGQVVAERGKLTIEMPSFEYPAWALNSVRFAKGLSAENFRLSAPEGLQVGTVQANIIGVIENQAPTRRLRGEVSVRNGEVELQPGSDLAKIALVERHQGSGRIQIGLVSGFGFNIACAAASTVAHDSHHMIVVGTSDEDMAQAANTLQSWGGGQVVVRKGEVVGGVELPIAGLMSDQPAEIVAEKAASVLDGLRACGCSLNNANMQLSLLALVVIPELRISDLGLVDVSHFEFIPVLER